MSRLGVKNLPPGIFTQKSICRLTPEYGSEDWVAPYVQSFLNDRAEARRPGLIATLREKSGMALEG